MTNGNNKLISKTVFCSFYAGAPDEGDSGAGMLKKAAEWHPDGFGIAPESVVFHSPVRFPPEPR